MKLYERLDEEQFEKLLRDREEFAQKFSKKWQASGITALVTPTYPHCSFKAKDAGQGGHLIRYNVLWNVLHYPAGIVPITRVQSNEQTFKDQYNDNWTDLINEIAKDSEGLPIGVQVIAHSYEDEKVLGVM